LTIVNERSFLEDFGGDLEALWGRALPQIGKMRFGSCAGEVAFTPSSVTTILYF